MDDIEAIRQLKARYFRTMDTKDWLGMRQVFTDDVIMDTSAAGGDVVAGADEFLAFLQPTLQEAITVHHGDMPEIEISSPSTASGIWALQDTIIWPDGTRMEGYGHYHETYEQVAGEWKIKSSTLTRLHVDFTTPEFLRGAEQLAHLSQMDAEIAVIVEAASGIGLALSRRCGSLGMAVALLDLDGDKGEVRG